MLEAQGIKSTLINPRFITGVDEELMRSLEKDHRLVVTLEDGVLDGGFGEKISRFFGTSPMKVINFGGKKEFLDHFDEEELLKANHLTAPQIVDDIKEALA